LLAQNPHFTSKSIFGLKLFVAVEKVAFLEKLPKVGDRRCPGNPRESFIAHPERFYFRDFSGKEFFNSHVSFRHALAYPTLNCASPAFQGVPSLQKMRFTLVEPKRTRHQK
jgi:hypothetical protein